jgi:hypothetical protein
MDRLNYSELVQTIIKGHVGKNLNQKIEVHVIFDIERDR